MPENNLTLHEIINLRGIISAKSLCAEKALFMLSNTDDRLLRSLIETDLEDTKDQICEIEALLDANIQ